MEAEKIAAQLFQAIEERQLIKPGKSENELNEDIFKLADELFGIKKYWHKRIVRSGVNTLVPYDDNPPDLMIQEDDILFLDFGPIIEDWEGDFGRTYVIGNDPYKHQLKNAIELAWHEAKAWFEQQRLHLRRSTWRTSHRAFPSRKVRAKKLRALCSSRKPQRYVFTRCQRK